ncbi:MAG: prepilin-type N-terminal cleavage/methylation domain-containing protein [Deltaproteobacteria bacterium]|jgi:prepilin-type N-terminal cleavage/methylation domain-containing protein|nr:prepilin-type N-terminal cleavage/methylation domain-containing protein [Deltaproteobacteria bacterium]
MEKPPKNLNSQKSFKNTLRKVPKSPKVGPKIGLNKGFKGSKKGFTVLELVAVLVIALIAFGVAYPGLGSYLKDSRLRSEAKRTEEFFWRAKRLAQESKNPVRVVLDCSKAKAKTCGLSLQTALVDKAAVVGWALAKDGYHPFHENVNCALIASLDKGQDGDKRIKGVHYGIFMPDQRVYSDPRPFEIFLFYSKNPGPGQGPGPGPGQSKGLAAGYRISIDNDNGRISSAKENRAI